MKKNIKKISLILLSALFSLVLMIAVACGAKNEMSVYSADGTPVFNSKTTSVTIEYAETYALPLNVQLDGKKVKLESVKLYDVSGKECRLSYGSYLFMAVGDYTVRYVANSVEKSFTIKCVDSSHPVINMHAATLFGIVGEKVTLPNFTAEDSAGINKASESISVVAPDGKPVTIDSERSISITQAGEYKITYSIADNHGNVSEKTFSITGYPKYTDETRENSVIYNFNNEEYLKLTMNLPKQLEANREIVSSGYPTIDKEESGNKVLKITSNATFDDVYTRFVLHEDLLASTGYRIVVRLAVSTDTDYVKLFRNQSSLNDKGLVAQQFGLKANVWYDFEINPISFGYNVAFKDFVIMFRDKGETALYIDEIYFTPIEFEDTSLANGVIADFDETGYLANIYQNVFGDPTTTRNEHVSGSDFSIVSGGELPAANGADTRTPGLAPSGSALKVETQFNRGGVTFMFPEPINLNEIIRLNLRVYIEDKPNVVVIGFFNGIGYDGGNNTWLNPSTDYFDEEWNDLTFSAEYLKTYTANDEISGFYLYTNARAYPAEMGHTIYIDEISVVERNETSEQTGDTVASFSSESSLANVAQNGRFNSSTFTYVEEKFGVNGVLAVQLARSNSGAKYFFDKTFKPTVNDALLLNIATQSTAVKSVNVYALNGASEVLIGTFDLTEHDGAFKKIAVKGKDLVNQGVADLCGLRFDIITTATGTQATLYLDGITLYNASADTNLPEIVSAANATYAGLQGNVSVDLSALNVQVRDKNDPTAEWYVVSLKDPKGVDVTSSIVENKFTPSSSGAYKVSVKARDIAGNESARTAEITVNVTIYTDKNEYYKSAWQFNDLGSTSIITGAEVQIHDVGNGNSAVAGLIKYDDFAPIGRQDFVIDMGGIYKVSEIRKIVIKYRYLNTSSTNLQLYVNGIGAGTGDELDITKRLTGMIYNGDGANWYTPTATETFATLSIPQSSLKSNSLGASSILTDDDYLTTLTFAQPSWKNAEQAMNHRAQIQIDSIEIIVAEFKAEHLEFNSFAAEGIVEQGLNVQMVDLENDNKAVQATFKRDSSGNRTIFRINMGGEYKVSEIERVEISYKITAGNANNWWYVYVSDLDYTKNDLRLTGLGITAKGETMTDFATFNISQASLKSNSLDSTLLGDDDYLTAISFVTNQYGDSTTIQIDYIRVVLKSNT